MNSTTLMAFLINALLQIPIIALAAAAASRLMRRAPARQQHLLWAAAVAASLAVPLLSTIPRSAARAALPAPAAATARAAQERPVSLDALLVHAQRPAAAGVNVMALLTAAYGAFLLYRIAALAYGWRRARRIVANTTADVSAEVRSRCGALTIDVPVFSSNDVATPMTLGALRPVIIVPNALLAELSDRALTAVLAHELAHIARRDFAANALIEIATLPIAFHPVTALLRRRLAETRELACDEYVTPRLVAPRDYARVLIDVAAFACAAPRPAYSLAMAGGDFEERIRRIVRRPGARHSRALLAAAWTALAATTVAAAAVAVHPRAAVVASRALSSSPDAATRAAAACDAGRARDASAIGGLVAMLGDDAPIDPMRCYDGSWTPALTTFGNPSPGEQAALALSSISWPAIDSLVAALDDPAPAVRRNAAWAIGEARGGFLVGRGAAVTPLIRLLGDRDATVRRAAAFGLSELKSRDAVEPLIVALADRDAAVRAMTARALGEIRDGRAEAALAHAERTDGDADVRDNAAWALGEIRGD